MISVIIPFYNEINLIFNCVKSVVNELNDINNFEIIICNDGPINNDIIFGKIKNLTQKTKIIINSQNKGPGGARNAALNESTGDIIAFLDADDLWLPGKIAAQLLAIEDGATFVTTGYRFDTGATLVSPPSSINNPLDIFLKRGIGTSTVIIHRSLLANLRFRDIRFAQDIDYWYSLAKSPDFRYCGIKTCFVEYSTNGSSKNKFTQLQYVYYVLKINKVPHLTCSRVLISYICHGIFKHFITNFRN